MTDTALTRRELERCADLIIQIENWRITLELPQRPVYIPEGLPITDASHIHTQYQQALQTHALQRLHQALNNQPEPRQGWLQRLREWWNT